MSYNPDIIPTNLEEWDKLIDHFTKIDNSKTREEWEQHFRSVGYYPQTENYSEPALTFEDRKRLKLAELAAAFETACNAATAEVNGLTINADKLANRNIAGLIVLLEAGANEGPVDFCLADNSFAQVDLATLKLMQLAIIEKAQQLYAQKWLLRAAIEEASDEAALNVVKISF